MADRTVLCIEPETATVNEVRRAFTPLGFHIESIPNGEEAIDKHSQSVEQAGRIRGRGRGGATGSRKRPQGGNQGPRQCWLHDICT